MQFRPLSCPQIMESLNQDFAAINSWCLAHETMRLNPKKTKSRVSRSRINAPGYSDLILGGAELVEVKILHIIGATLDSKIRLSLICVKLCQRQPGV